MRQDDISIRPSDGAPVNCIVDRGMRKDSQIERIRKGSSVREQRPPKSTQQKQLHPPKRPTSDVSEVPAGAVPRRKKSRTR